MVINIDDVANGFKKNQKLQITYNTYEKYVNYRFDYIIRASLTRAPDQLNKTKDYSAFDPTQKTLFACINSNNNERNIAELREEVKNLVSEINTKRKEITIVNLQAEGVRNNIKNLEEIIAIKETFIEETYNYAKTRSIAKEKVLKEYSKVNKKHQAVSALLSKLSKSMKSNSSNGTSKEIEYLNEKIQRYEAKIKKMKEVIKIADESKEKLEQYQDDLQTSKNRLKSFYGELTHHLKIKQDLKSFINSKEKYVKEMNTNLSNLGVLSSIEKSRHSKFLNIIENNNLKKEFVDLRNMRTEVLSSRPKGMFNPKYQKGKYLTKEEIRKYLENDEAVESIDYLIELKNFENNSELNIVKYIQMNSNERSIFMKCLSALSEEEIKKLLVHYFVKNVDLKESGRETDDLIAELDESIIRHKRTIVNINNDFQEFHLSTEKQFAQLKNYYQGKVNALFKLLQEENNALTVLKLKQDIGHLKKKIIELEKEKTKIAKSKIITIVQETSNKDLDIVEASKSGSEATSAKVTVKKNKLKIQKIKSKLNLN